MPACRVKVTGEHKSFFEVLLLRQLYTMWMLTCTMMTIFCLCLGMDRERFGLKGQFFFISGIIFNTWVRPACLISLFRRLFLYTRLRVRQAYCQACKEYFPFKVLDLVVKAK